MSTSHDSDIPFIPSKIFPSAPDTEKVDRINKMNGMKRRTVASASTTEKNEQRRVTGSLCRCQPRGDTMCEETSKPATVYFEPALHRAIRLKAAHTHQTVSEIVNDALRLALREDHEDLAAFEDRVAERVISYQALLKDLKAHARCERVFKAQISKTSSRSR
ncbi:MAG TPA: hypothetical protein VFS47_02740 [Steroidobacteraceae bacterium]|nr:hypothetical protein [Steroidobacteraceae bacterium]